MGLWGILLASGATVAGAEVDAVKAAFLYRFAQYCQWPESSFESDQSPIVIGVVGPDEVLRHLEETVAGKEAQGRRIEVKSYRVGTDVPKCHILFLGAALNRNVPEYLRKTWGQAILTVGEHPRFVEEGGVIGLAMESRKDRLSVNLTAAEAGKLKIDSQLLKLAKVVRATPEKLNSD